MLETNKKNGNNNEKIERRGTRGKKNNEGVRLNKKAWGEKRKKIEQKNTLKKIHLQNKNTQNPIKVRRGVEELKKHFSE